jgi:hypothetical protein
MRPGALLVQPDAFLINKRIVALAERDALPVMYQSRDLVAGGGLMSYGPSLSDQWRQMGIYVGKVLKGTNPGGLPVLQPTKFELAINMKTAKALGLRLSNNLLSLADELIERMARCPLLPLSGHSSLHRTCPLSGVKRTSLVALHMSANDPKRTSLRIGAHMRRREFICVLGGMAMSASGK